MKVEVTYTGDEDSDIDDLGIKIKVDGKKRFQMGAGEPEDMNLGRDLADAYNVLDLMKEAHAAGLRGEALEVTEIGND